MLVLLWVLGSCWMEPFFVQCVFSLWGFPLGSLVSSYSPKAFRLGHLATINCLWMWKWKIVSVLALRYTGSGHLSHDVSCDHSWLQIFLFFFTCLLYKEKAIREPQLNVLEELLLKLLLTYSTIIITPSVNLTGQRRIFCTCLSRQCYNTFCLVC